ncbi:unnamed protein product [Phaedon cochleariae]|uniref:5'-3' exoribonuclease 2 n=1 Tax=Phaedon cochleariae TaxID=80249 RepID=A0A9N9SC43_PHACE|nr:unnamed protein product [Phaedon cochleariae]
MGVPKFFRYMSERYPCLSELVKEYQIPEFDNLYLDMNGIIHMCSHPDDGNVHFRISEEKIFKDVFHYIEVLFRMIKPQKLFFMAVDGVAPRAKMNQQRGRRFRSAKDSEKQEADALKKGEKLPEEARFDSNCITPGTVFMARLHQQLQYFVVDKISNDPMWQKCKVILSGHETPGEGEHKIMDYIRYMRAQPGYDPNTRHCLYGLDADLIMLGLCTHEPHFSLLREEVKFGKKSNSNNKRLSVPEEITFFLLHLSLMREYLELEFASLKDKLRGFSYDFEKIIDDWVLMGFLVGNDFIPHLPNLHITNGALPILYKAYMDILPTLDGYINEAGKLNLARFEKFMEKLSALDVENFAEIRDDMLYMEAKTGRKYNAHSKVSTKKLEEWTDDSSGNIDLIALEDESPKDSGLAALIRTTDEFAESDDDGETDESQSEDDIAFSNYKKEYYMNKLEYAKVTPEVMRSQAEGYVRAIQWNLNYYYNGCCSWSWYYPHHYAPYISDIKGFSDLTLEFDIGKPFLPYEQLLAVLPTASKNLLPSCFHSLMVDENSLIKKYYPEDFQTDLNGKKQEWEAVVLVPFIDENLLLEAMGYCNDKMTTEEKERNRHGPMLIYMFTPRDKGPYPAPEYFSDIPHNHTDVKSMLYNEIVLPEEKLVKGAYPGVKMNVYYPGFPTMKHLKYKAELKIAKIKVFEHPSRSENMIITLIPDQKFLGEAIPVDLLGTTVFVGWPHLVEAKVTAISNAKKTFISMGGPNQYNVQDQSSPQIFNQQVQGIREYYQKRMGIEFGETKVLVHVQVMIGRKYLFSPNGRLTLEKQFTQNTSNYPLQTIVFNIAAYDSHTSVFRDIEQVFPKNSVCFTLSNLHYGSQGVVLDSSEVKKTGRMKISISVIEEPNLNSVRELYYKTSRSYKSLYELARKMSIPNMIFSRITGSIFVSVRNNSGELKSSNIGLDLKLNKKNKETPGYTRKINNTWHYTEKAADLVMSYGEKFPEVFSFLSTDTNFDDVTDEKLFGDNCDDRLKELQSWLKTLPVHTIERQTCGSDIIEPEVVEEIEKTVDNIKPGNVKKVTMSVKPMYIYRPEVQNGTLMPDPKTETKILDRIVNVREGFSVPFGLKGTVIAIQQPSTGCDRDIMYDVVFDKPFRDGMKLNCSENRGYRLPKTSFINLSYGQRLTKQKNGKADERVESSNNGRYNPESAAPQQAILQKWFPPQQQPYVETESPPSFNQSNSAFAQFSVMNAQRNKQRDCVEAYYNKDKINQIKKDYTRFQKGENLLDQSQQNEDGEDKENFTADSQKSDPKKGDDEEQNDRQERENKKSYGQEEQQNYSYDKKQQNYENSGYRNLQGQDYRRDGRQSYNKQDYSRYSGEPQNGNYRQNYNPQPTQQWRQHQQGFNQDDFNSSPQKSNNYFMPNYANNGQRSVRNEGPRNEGQRNQGNTNERQRPQQMPTNHKVRDADNKEPDDLPKRAHTVNTNFLKNLLRIGGNINDNTNPPTVDKKETAPLVDPKIHRAGTTTSSNISFDMLTPVANAPASIRLLTYYQSNGLGLPRYQYFNVKNMTQAQITLSDGKLVIGKPAESREAASENVAVEVLEFLMKKVTLDDKPTSRSDDGIPIPPMNWFRKQDEPSSAQQTKHKSSSKTEDQSIERSSKNKSEATAVLNNSLVPLQAVKSHINKASISKPLEQGKNESTNVADTSEKVSNKGAKMKDSPKGHQQNRPKRERKTRIAANFVNKNN